MKFELTEQEKKEQQKRLRKSAWAVRKYWSNEEYRLKRQAESREYQRNRYAEKKAERQAGAALNQV